VMLQFYLRACQPSLPLLECSDMILLFTSQQYVPCTNWQLCAEVQHRSNMGEASKGVTASGRGVRISPLPFPAADVCLLCCLQVCYVCSAPRRHACYQPT
jgi:hypothetical protein